jgi:hypothetical protein
MCCKCNENKIDKTFFVNRGYGSRFDLMEITIPLCNTCINELGIKDEWFENNPNEQFEYTYEDELENVITSINSTVLSGLIKEIKLA